MDKQLNLILDGIGTTARMDDKNVLTVSITRDDRLIPNVLAHVIVLSGQAKIIEDLDKTHDSMATLTSFQRTDAEGKVRFQLSFKEPGPVRLVASVLDQKSGLSAVREITVDVVG